ncbi:hypothetical protein OE88DRAFT_1388436 [Heliocybe sulcata]|uniref:Uncharacterized protein n=1 Tax=Heliocybe sulcata TaxID=5364 RepID=A0A5C3NFN2_9AGAM|nr:hypothetical protein OE88DRAFT_1388436 [Heliocybe sulcata]
MGSEQCSDRSRLFVALTSNAGNNRAAPRPLACFHPPNNRRQVSGDCRSWVYALDRGRQCLRLGGSHCRSQLDRLVIWCRRSRASFDPRAHDLLTWPFHRRRSTDNLRLHLAATTPLWHLLIAAPLAIITRTRNQITNLPSQRVDVVTRSLSQDPPGCIGVLFVIIVQDRCRQLRRISESRKWSDLAVFLPTKLGILEYVQYRRIPVYNLTRCHSCRSSSTVYENCLETKTA